MGKKKTEIPTPILVGVLVLVVVYFIYDKVFGKGTRLPAALRGSYRYKAKHTSRSKAAALPTPEQARQAARAIGGTCKFLLAAKQHLQRDYILVVDRSGSMSGSRWREATDAVRTLAPHICKFDPDGITLILFDHEVLKFENITSADQVNEIMGANPPRGSTDLAAALDTSFSEYFEGKTDNPCSILVCTDGAPNDRDSVANCIIAATKAMEIDAELSVSFIAIGADRGCKNFLQYLDDGLEEKGAAFDIVDTIFSTEAKGKSFNELIAMSIYD